MSGKREFGDGAYRFEELARRQPTIGEGDVKLEIRLGSANGQASYHQPGAPGEFEHRIGVFECGRARVMHDDTPWACGLADQPLARHARERVATGPARGVERFELDGGGLPHHAADDERVAPAAASRDGPPRQVSRLEEDDHCHLCELGFALVYDELYGARAQPADGRALAERRQAALHPAHHLAAETNVPDRAGGEPGDDRDRGDSDEFGHGGGDDSTPVARGWKQALREFLYGLSGYEIAQQALEIRATIERLFMLGVFGDMLGVPILPPYYGLRLLPFVVPQVETWKRSLLRERELGSDHEHHLHGV